MPASKVVLTLENVAVAFDGIKDAFKARAIQMAGNFAAQDVQLIQILFPVAESLPSLPYLKSNP